MVAPPWYCTWRGHRPWFSWGSDWRQSRNGWQQACKESQPSPGRQLVFQRFLGSYHNLRLSQVVCGSKRKVLRDLRVGGRRSESSRLNFESCLDGVPPFEEPLDELLILTFKKSKKSPNKMQSEKRKDWLMPVPKSTALELRKSKQV